MQIWIVLLRGINVGGKHIVPMKKLRELLEKAEFSDIQTYIQSGNCVFASEEANADVVAVTVSDLIEKEFGFRPSCFAISPADLNAAIDANPFPSDAGKALHMMFLERVPSPDSLAELREILPANEQAEIVGKVLYVHTPDGFGRSVIGKKLDRFIKVDMTARNLNSVLKLAEMARTTNA